MIWKNFFLAREFYGYLPIAQDFKYFEFENIYSNNSKNAEDDIFHGFLWNYENL